MYILFLGVEPIMADDEPNAVCECLGLTRRREETYNNTMFY